MTAIKEDEESRKKWEQRLSRGIRLLGVTDDNSAGPFVGASRVVHPLIAEAGVQFQARAIAEAWPAEGPAKARPLGDPDDEILERADRVQQHLNYQYTVEMREAFEEHDMMLNRLPLDGSAFKKVHDDPHLGRLTAEFVAAEDLIVPYNATSLSTSPRVTHLLRKYKNDVLKDMAAGFYRNVDLQEPSDDQMGEIAEEVAKAEGREANANDEDKRYKIYECHCDRDLVGYEDIDTDGKMTGIAIPYIISIEESSAQVLSIRRNWRQKDPRKLKREWFIHYKYLPGLGFYGFGLLHMIGGLARAATGALRALLDSAQFSNLQGGFKSRDAKFAANDATLRPGEWKDSDMTSDDLSKSFFKIPYGEPSQVLFALLGFVVESGERFASTTEAMVGDADNKGPVGTTVALIEQGSKVFSAIHKRLHRAFALELELVAELNFETLPADEPYPYRVAGGENFIMREDYDERVDVQPVSDPNIFSATQRIAQSQAVLQMASEPGSTIDRREAERGMLRSLRVPDADNLAPDPTHIVRMSAVEENMALLHGKPIKVFLDQDHGAHMAVLESWFQGLPNQAQKMLEGSYFEHLGAHMAYQYRLEMEQMIGAPLPPPPDFSKAGKEQRPRGGPPPEVEQQIDAAAAQASQLYAQEHPPQKSPDQVKAEGEAQERQADLQNKSRALDIEEQRRTREADQEDRRLQIEEIEKGANAPVNAEVTRLKGETDARNTLMKTEGDKQIKQLEVERKYAPEIIQLQNEKDIRIAGLEAEKRKETAIEVAKITSQEDKETAIEVAKITAKEDKAAKIKSAEIAADAKPKGKDSE